MKTNANDTPKVVGLIVGILFVLGFAVFRVLRVAQPPVTEMGTSTSGTMSLPRSSSQGTGAAAITPASEVDTATAQRAGLGEAGPGMVRRLSNLDAERDPGSDPGPAPGSPLAFREIKADPPPTLAVNPTTPSVKNGGRGPGAGPFNVLGGFNSGLDKGSGFPQPGGDPVSRPPKPIPPPPPPSPAITLDGVLAGANGFAILTVREPGASAEGGGTVVYRYVGEKVGRYTVQSIDADGVTLSGRSLPLLVGQTLGGKDSPRADAPRTTPEAPAPTVTPNPQT